MWVDGPVLAWFSRMFSIQIFLFPSDSFPPVQDSARGFALAPPSLRLLSPSRVLRLTEIGKLCENLKSEAAFSLPPASRKEAGGAVRLHQPPCTVFTEAKAPQLEMQTQPATAAPGFCLPEGTQAASRREGFISTLVNLQSFLSHCHPLSSIHTVLCPLPTSPGEGRFRKGAPWLPTPRLPCCLPCLFSVLFL